MAASNSPPRAVRATARVPVRRPARRSSQPDTASQNREKRQKRFRGGRARRPPLGTGGGRGDRAVGGNSLMGSGGPEYRLYQPTLPDARGRAGNVRPQ